MLGPYLGSRIQPLDNSGNIGANIYIKFTEPGDPSTLRDVYTDYTLATPLTNPVQMDAYGRKPIWLSGVYDVYYYLGDPDDLINPGSLIYSDTNVNIISLYLNGVIDTLANLKAETNITNGRAIFLTDSGRGGEFVFSNADLSTEVTADTQNGIYVPPNSDTTGASGAWVRRYSGNIKARWFGAVGNNSTDDTTALKAAVAFAVAMTPKSGTVELEPNGIYIASDTITLSDGVRLVGSGIVHSGTVIKAATTLNVSLIKCTGRSKIHNLSIQGSNDVTKTLQFLIEISATNDVHVRDVTLINGFTHIYVGGSTACFYLNFVNVNSQGAKYAHLHVDNTSSSGVDIVAENFTILGAAGNHGWMFEQGLGSIISSDCRFSLTSGTAAAELVYFGTPASAYGGAQFTNAVFESSALSTTAAVRFVGTAVSPWKEVHFSNCLFTGKGGEALKLAYVDGLDIDNSTLSSTNAGGALQFVASTSSTRISLSNIKFEGATGVEPIQAVGDTVIEMSLINPDWPGNSALMDLSNVTAGNLKLTVLGGNPGANATPIILNDYKNTEKNIEVFTDNYGPLQRYTFTGTLDGSGAATVAHGVTQLYKKIITLGAWYKGGSGEAIPLSVSYIDGNNVSLSGGTASANYRFTALYNTEVDSAW